MEALAVRCERGALAVRRQEFHAVRGEERPVEPVEVERHEAGSLVLRHLPRVVEKLVEAPGRPCETRCLHHRPVHEEQRLADVEGNEVLLALVNPGCEELRVVPVADLRLPCQIGVRSTMPPLAAYSSQSAPCTSMMSGATPPTTCVW